MITRRIKILTLTLLLSAGIGAFGQNSVYLYLKDNTKLELLLADKPIVTYGDNLVQIKSAAVDLEYTASEIARISFEANNNSIWQIEAKQDPLIDIQNNQITFNGFPPASPVNVFTPSGQRQATYIIDENGCLAVNLDGYQSGIYLFSVNQITYKLIKK